MDALTRKVQIMPWFELVPNSVWEDWSGPESTDVERIGEKTQEIIDFLCLNEIEAEPSISQSAKKLMGEMPAEFSVDTQFDLYNAKYFASWVGVWLLVAQEKYMQAGFQFPPWADSFLSIYRRGLWPSGLNEDNEPIYSKST